MVEAGELCGQQVETGEFGGLKGEAEACVFSGQQSGIGD